jgi:hypothetical protein
VIECLPDKHEALSSNYSIIKKKKKKEKERTGGSARWQWITLVIPATWEAEIKRPSV